MPVCKSHHAFTVPNMHIIQSAGGQKLHTSYLIRHSVVYLTHLSIKQYNLPLWCRSLCISVWIVVWFISIWRCICPEARATGRDSLHMRSLAAASFVEHHWTSRTACVMRLICAGLLVVLNADGEYVQGCWGAFNFSSITSWNNLRSSLCFKCVFKFQSS